MTIQTILGNFVEKDIISGEKADQVAKYELNRAFSIHWELRSILYLGILLLTSGLGVLIYQNIDTIGHQIIICVIILLTAGCFFYVYKNRQPFGWKEINHTNKFAEYTLLLGCTLFLILEGYLQFQYTFFGTKYGLAIFIPTAIFFLCAYWFDNRGVLSMAITGLASWLGLTIAPLSVLEKNDFTDSRLITTALILGFALVAISWVSRQKDLKKHFEFTYLLLGGNLAMLAAMIGLFDQEIKIVYFVAGAALSYWFIIYSRQNQSLIFLLLGVIYGYIILTYAVFIILPSDFAMAVSIHYFLLTSIAVLFFLLNVKKILGIKK